MQTIPSSLFVSTVPLTALISRGTFLHLLVGPQTTVSLLMLPNTQSQHFSALKCLLTTHTRLVTQKSTMSRPLRILVFYSMITLPLVTNSSQFIIGRLGHWDLPNERLTTLNILVLSFICTRRSSFRCSHTVPQFSHPINRHTLTNWK